MGKPLSWACREADVYAAKLAVYAVKPHVYRSLCCEISSIYLAVVSSVTMLRRGCAALNSIRTLFRKCSRPLSV